MWGLVLAFDPMSNDFKWNVTPNKHNIMFDKELSMGENKELSWGIIEVLYSYKDENICLPTDLKYHKDENRISIWSFDNRKTESIHDESDRKLASLWFEECWAVPTNNIPIISHNNGRNENRFTFRSLIESKLVYIDTYLPFIKMLLAT